MTVSATATAAAVFFSFVFAATASTAVATTSAAFTAHQFEDAFHFLVGCIAHFHYGTFKNQSLPACGWFRSSTTLSSVISPTLA